VAGSNRGPTFKVARYQLSGFLGRHMWGAGAGCSTSRICSWSRLMGPHLGHFERRAARNRRYSGDQAPMSGGNHDTPLRQSTQRIWVRIDNPNRDWVSPHYLPFAVGYHGNCADTIFGAAKCVYEFRRSTSTSSRPLILVTTSGGFCDAAYCSAVASSERSRAMIIDCRSAAVY
jgi:hypothetical protein